MRAHCPKCRRSDYVRDGALGERYSSQALLAVEVKGELDCGHKVTVVTSIEQWAEYERRAA